MSDEIMDNEVTEQPDEQPSKAFSQDDVERIVSERLARERKKYERKLDGIDIDKAKQLLAEQEQAELERQKERGEFEKVLKTTVEKKEQQINELRQQLNTTLIDGQLLNTASSANAVNPEQVSALLRNQVRLGETGQVEVLDKDGSVQYNDKGELLTVNELVNTFLTANPHFVKASNAGTGSQGNAGGSTPKPQSVAEMLENWNNGGKEAYAKLKRKS